jgi:fimbrial chaperone protein
MFVSRVIELSKRASSALLGLALCAAVLAACRQASAASISVSPTAVDLSADRRAVSLIVANPDIQAKIVQLKVFAWLQNGGDERLAPSDEVLAGPPVFMLQPLSTQVIRVGLKLPPQPGPERAFRLFVSEVPPAASHFSSITIAFRISLPVFVSAGNVVTPQISWSAARVDAAHLRISAYNAGNVHLAVRSLKILDGGAPSAAPLGQALSGYVLARSSKTWTVTLQRLPASGYLTLSLRTNQGASSVAVTLPGR